MLDERFFLFPFFSIVDFLYLCLPKKWGSSFFVRQCGIDLKFIRVWQVHVIIKRSFDPVCILAG
jgi:hypothetical protein